VGDVPLQPSPSGYSPLPRGRPLLKNVRLFDSCKALRFGAFSLALLGNESHERNQGKETFLYTPLDASKRPNISMRIGYARVSTHEQNLDLKKDTLKKARCEKIVVDMSPDRIIL
jgi:hypothetical protein